ncbi:hypothetical protein ES705_18370 [subsurface metagenome]
MLERNRNLEVLDNPEVKKALFDYDHKICRYGNHLLLVSEFEPDARGAFGLRADCRECKNKRSRARNEKKKVKDRIKELHGELDELESQVA